MYNAYNPNPAGIRVGDCTVRALCRATGESWDSVYCGLCVEGMRLCDMPSSNQVWGAYLRRHGFKRRTLPDECPDCYTVAEFCRDHPQGTYVLSLSGHVVCVSDGVYYDSWDSGAESPSYYWQKEA